MLLCGTLWLSPWLPQGFHQFQTAETSAILALLFLGVFPGALAYLTWMVAVGELGAARAANLLFFMAPAAALISIPVVGTWPGPTTVVGGLIALIGVLIVHRSKLTAEQQRSAPSLNR